jgi:seryl-tRNA synthetase
MLDLQFVTENQALVEENCRNRGVSVDVARVVELARQRSQLIVEGDKHRHEQKEIAAQIPKISDKEQRQALVDKGKQLKQLVAENDGVLKTLEPQLRELEMQIPNLTHPDAPVGAGDQANRTVRTWGEKQAFDFKPRDHVELMERLDLVDLEAGARVAGHGFYFLKNEAVFLELGLVQLALEKLRAAGFTVFTTPDLARDDVLQGIGFLPRGPEAQIYSIEKSDLSLVATAEITLGGSRKDQILEAASLPLKYAGLSHCFRTEAGAHGKATRGIYRVHQFTKVEMFGFTKPDVALSDAFLEQVVAIEENMFQTLGIPYRVIDTCTGDLGGPAYRKFDLEAWMPGRDEYGEVTSASNCTDYQARRLGIRVKGGAGEKKGTQFVHTLNGTAVAATRAIIAILENYQQADGSVIIPEALRKWVGQDRITPRT